MSRIFGLLGALALAVALASASYGQGFEIDIGGDQPGGGTPGTITDSTTWTLANGGTDTTGWFNIAAFKFPPCQVAGTPLVIATISSNMEAGDTLGVTVQYSPDQVNIFSKSETAVIGASPQQVAVMLCDTWANEKVTGNKFVRLLIQDDDVTRTAAYTSMTAKYSIIQQKGR